MRKTVNLGSQSGQAALIIIMIMAVVGVISTSVASRSIEGLRTQEIENEGSKAFRAAEAGLEAALNARTNVSGEIGTGEGSLYEATYSSDGDDGFVSEGVEEGDLVQVSLAGASNGLSSLNIYWNSNAALKIAFYSGNTASADYSVTYSTSDPDTSGRTSDNNFTATTNTAGYTFKGVSFDNQTSVAINMLADPAPVMVRITTLYERSNIGVEPVGGSLPDGQAVTVTSTGTVAESLKSKVTLQKFADRIPVIFDNVLYTNGNLTQ